MQEAATHMDIGAEPVARSDDYERTMDNFRRWGYLQARLDPLGRMPPAQVPELELAGPDADQARVWYCGSIGVEFMHIRKRARRLWIQERMERRDEPPDGPAILERIIRAKVFEQVLHARYPGTKRFSLEGAVSLIPLLDEILEGAAASGTSEVVLGMTHRGRLNVMTNIVGRKPEEVFAGFEDVNPRSVLGGGDVKYHIGATGSYVTRQGTALEVHLVSNPSHLEAVDAVVLGRSRAKQARSGAGGTVRVLPLLIHGDAAFAGQGIAAESLNMEHLAGYDVGGCVHIIVNNLIGFTGVPAELHSSHFASDLARRLPIPIFHVNAEDPAAVVKTARLAIGYRLAFGSDVFVDLVGFRLHGHSEIDDPSITQPVLYAAIREHPPLYKLYAAELGIDPSARVDELRMMLSEAQESAASTEKSPVLRELPRYWSSFIGGPFTPSIEVGTAVPPDELGAIAVKVTSVPGSFNIHPKVKRLLDQRAGMGEGRLPVDFGMAETLAFGSLLRQGVPVRLSGQDSRRGTFNQRHAVLIDAVTQEEYVPLSRCAAEGARFEVYNSPLSEASVLAFEYGYSRDFPEALVVWEAQFGDFANGGQVIIDQFIAAGEDKWGLLSGLVMLLPHGYEGQGPEHSSARIERFLQLAAEDNIQVCLPSTAAQYFHLIRRQALRRWRKPLVVFTPKSMLRSPQACSALAEFGGAFRNVLDDPDVEGSERVLLCTGKIGHELRRTRKSLGERSTAIVSVEQLYPFPAAELREVIERHAGAREFVWVQEEPANMGALGFIVPRLEEITGGKPVRSVKRSASASPATGSAKAHALEQATLLSLAFPSMRR